MFELDPVDLLIRVPIVLMALTVHEFCHAWFALKMGDQTAYRLGRCTLNPIRHLDPLGTLCLMFAPIGWAKPVPINSLNFHNRRQGILVATGAGPASNVIQAILFALMLRGLPYLANSGFADSPSGDNLVQAVGMMAFYGVAINVGLAVFNCLPIFPLDGFHITLQLMRPQNQQRFLDSARFGPFMILGLVLISNYTDYNILRSIIMPPTQFILRHVAGWG